MLLSLALAAVQPSAADVERDYERWERCLRAKVSALHDFPAGADKHEISEVVVSFSIGKDGRPTDAVVRKSSGNPTYDRAARHVVRRLGRIGPIPAMTGQDRRVLLKLSYGFAPTATADRQLAGALDAERQFHSRRNLEMVTMAVYPSSAAGPRGTER